MRRLALMALAACGTDPRPSDGVTLVLDIPNGVLDPKGYSTVEVTYHDPTGDLVRSTAVGPDNQFDLGDIKPRKDVWVEAALRNERGTAVGYGRTAAPGDLEAGQEIVVPIRRPIAYIAGLASRDVDMNPNTDDTDWYGVAATFSDLSSGTMLDGSTTVGMKPVLMVSAGPELFSIDQEAQDPVGTLIGPATIRPISTGDHSMAGQLAGTMTGAVQDGAGSDDGTTLIIGTTQKLFVIDTRLATATPVREIASGNFGRVAVVTASDGSVAAVAIENRIATTGACNATGAKLWWIANTGAEVIDAHPIATGGFADVASDGGRAYYVDACKGELGEALSTGVKSLRSGLGRPTAVAVSNNQAFVGIEKPNIPSAVALLVMPINTADAPRALWAEAAQQVLRAVDLPGVERRLDARSATFQQLEVGAGGDYIAVSLSAVFHGAAIPEANFPSMDIVTEELRVFDAASGGVVQRYRSWCDGSYLVGLGDIDAWACAATTGQSEPRSSMLEHRVTSMTFLFGKK